VIEKYKELIADNPQVEMIHVSRDEGEGSAENWAEKAGFPWLTVLPKNVKRSGLLDYKTESYVPFYALVNAQGEPLASGQNEVFAKIAELTK